MDYSIAVFFVGALFLYLALLIVWYIIFIIANWKIFTKAGEEGWKAIIPFYNAYILYKISWNTQMFWVLLGCAVIGGIFAFFGSVFAVVGFAFNIAAAVIGLIQSNKLSSSFGHGIGFTLGLIFLNPIFILILGFGSSKYLGSEG